MQTAEKVTCWIMYLLVDLFNSVLLFLSIILEDMHDGVWKFDSHLVC